MVPHGSSAKFSLDNSSGTPVDLSGYTTEVQFSPEIAMHMKTVFGMASQSRLPGLKDAKMTANFMADPVLSLHLIGLYVAQSPGSASTWSFVYGPNGSATGAQRVSGELLITGMPIESKVDAERRIVATFEVTGDLTFDVY